MSKKCPITARLPPLVLAAIGAMGPPGEAWAAVPSAKLEEICQALTEDSSFKVRLQAALVLGKLKDARAVPCLVRALDDKDQGVRAVSAQALGRIGDRAALPSLLSLAQRDPAPFVRGQADKAAALLKEPASDRRAGAQLNFGPFTGGAKSAGPAAGRIVRDRLAAELGKLPGVTIAPAGEGGQPGGAAFWIDGNITQLSDIRAPAASETSCGVRVLIAQWPTKSIMAWTSAEASVQSGARSTDRDSARRDCLEAVASQLAEDLARYLKIPGG